MDIEKMINEVRKLYKLQQIIPEWEWFLKQVETAQPEIILEIGMASGASSLCLSYFTKNLISIDKLMPKNKNVFDDIRKNCKFIFIKYESVSKECRTILKKKLDGRKIDVLFIDGEHSYNGAKNDFTKFKKFMKPGGIIGIHDIVASNYHYQNNCRVYKLWQQIKDKYPSSEKTTTNWGGIGVIKLPTKT